MIAKFHKTKKYFKPTLYLNSKHKSLIILSALLGMFFFKLRAHFGSIGTYWKWKINNFFFFFFSNNAHILLRVMSQ